MSEPLRLLAIFPHPEDETLGCGPALARYAAEGVEVHLVCATRGQMGWTGPAEKNPGPDALGQMREAELQCAARKLGLYRVHLLDYMDGALDQVDRPEIVGVITGH
ncbi:MAG: PIG-L family deacetylase, partial [Anaerolineaceae bacterium]